MDAQIYSETFEPCYQTTQHHIPEYSIHQRNSLFKCTLFIQNIREEVGTGTRLELAWN
jgi:hypothetical protein